MYKCFLRFGLLWLSILPVGVALSSELLPFAGLTAGSAVSSSDDPFDATDSAYLFIGIQTEYYVTYELGATRIDTNKPKPIVNQRRTLSMLGVSALGHLPIGDSSLFVRLGVSGYQYFDPQDVLQDVFVPTYGAGLDLGIIPRLTLRLEWQRYVDMELNHVKFDIEAIRIGLFYYF